MKIAIVGSGISGLAAAYLLQREHEVVVFEASDYIGGHTHTVPVRIDGSEYAIDTGFIVFNTTTYPNFSKILDRLGVESQPTSMSFSVKSATEDFEFNGNSLNTFFSQRQNIFKPRIYRILFDMLRFNRKLDDILLRTRDSRSLAGFLEEQKFSADFLKYFILPITSSLWSAPLSEARDFPMALFARFFKNHGILNIRNRLKWRVIKGGSREYVKKLTTDFAEGIRLNCPVQQIRRDRDGVEIESTAGVEHFDQIVLATHADQALALLADASNREQEILGTMSYRQNVVQMHTDTSVMPGNRKIWASWNYAMGSLDQQAKITYDMNILQSLTSSREILVSLNQEDDIDPDKVIDTYHYAHPVYTPSVPAAQDCHAEISGKNHTHYCGAYWGYGFHEDAVRSALAVCKHFGETL